MIPLDLTLDADGRWPELKDRDLTWVRSDTEGSLKIGTLTGGMVSGLPSVAIRIDTPDGKSLVIETSARLFILAARAIAVRYERELAEEGHA